MESIHTNNITIDVFIDELCTDPNVEGILLFGSRAHNSLHSNSDVDLVVITKVGFDKVIKRKDEIVFDILYIPARILLENTYRYKDAYYWLWSKAQILYSENNLVESLQTEAQSIFKTGKQPISNNHQRQLYYDKISKLALIKEISSQEPAIANFLLFQSAQELTETFFDLQQKWTPPPKQRLQSIRTLNPQLGSFLKQFYADTTMKERWDLLEKMAELILT